MQELLMCFIRELLSLPPESTERRLQIAGEQNMCRNMCIITTKKQANVLGFFVVLVCVRAQSFVSVISPSVCRFVSG